MSVPRFFGAAALSVCACLAWTASRADAGIMLGENLLSNAGAEAGPGGTGQVVPVPGWSVTAGSFTVATYGGAPAFPTAASPGPADKGSNFFAGGGSGESRAEQRFSLFGLGRGTKGGGLAFELSGWLGGAGTQDDGATLSVTFLDGSESVLDSFSIGPVLSGDRDDVTGMLFRETDGLIPVGAAEAVVELTMDRAGVDVGFNDGSADNLSFVVIPSPGGAVLLLAGGVVAAMRRR